MLVKELFAKFGLDVNTQSFVKGQLLVEGLKLGLHVLGRAAEAAGGFLRSLTVDVIEYADHIEKASQKTGIGVEALQEIAYAAKLSDVSLGDLTQSLGFLSKNMFEAVQGSKETQRAFREIGVSVTDSKGRLRSTDAVLMDISNVLANIPDGAAKTAKVMQLFGRSSSQLIPFLNQGAEGISKLREEARRLGIVLDESAVKEGVKADEAMKRLNATWAAMKRQIGARLLPVLNQLLEKFQEWLGYINKAIPAIIRFGTVFVANFKRIVKALALAATAVFTINLYLKGQLVLWLLTKLAAIKAAIAATAAWIAAAAPFILIAGLIGGLTAIWSGFLDDWMKPKADDPWWLSALKTFVQMIAGIPTVLGVAFDWLKKKVMWVYDKAKWVYDHSAGYISRVGSAIGEGAGFVYNKANSALDSAFGVTPAAPVTTDSMRSRVNTPIQAYTNVTINAPNSNAREIHEIAKKEVAEHWYGQMRTVEGGL